MSSHSQERVTASSQEHDVPMMVHSYKKLFLLLVAVTGLGIVLAYLHMPVWLAVVLGLGIIIYKSSVVVDAFKHLILGRPLLILVFAMTAIFFVSLLLGPIMTHEDPLLGTIDISKEVQRQQQLDKPAHSAEAAHSDGAAHSSGH